MTFPVYLGAGEWKVHPHLVFEPLVYIVAAWLVIRSRSRHGDALTTVDRWAIAAAAMIGGALGGRLLFWLDQYASLAAHWRSPLEWPIGKTIVGGLLGGLIAVEMTKRHRHVRVPTGDLFAIPLAIGIAVGRIGCFLTGLDDHTFGTSTTWWTGVNFGDGIRRHPTALYEAVFLVGLALLLSRPRLRESRRGTQFRLFMIAYLAFRFALDFIKPEPVFALGLSMIQWACAAALAYYVISERSRHGHVYA